MTLRKLFVAAAATAFLLSALAGHADAQGRGRGSSKSKSKGKVSAPATPANAQIEVIFKASDRPKFQQYFVTHKFVADPLPPGIAMNIARGKPLPGGINRRVMPADLRAYVPNDPKMTYYIVGDRVVAVRDGTIIDVLLNILK